MLQSGGVDHVIVSFTLAMSKRLPATSLNADSTLAAYSTDYGLACFPNTRLLRCSSRQVSLPFHALKHVFFAAPANRVLFRQCTRSP